MIYYILILIIVLMASKVGRIFLAANLIIILIAGGFYLTLACKAKQAQKQHSQEIYYKSNRGNTYTNLNQNLKD